MGEKRKAPARGGESAAKRKLSESTLKRDTTPAKRKASATPTIPPSPEPEKKILPTHIKDGDPLPTLTKPQPSTLSLQEYQSYAESAVLAAALQRSRIKWLNDCVFEKYWTKPSKKKSQPQPPQNPPRESMSKLGPCSIIIEPHHFEAMLFTVRNPQAQQPIQYAPPQRPIVQYAPPNNFHQYQPPPGHPRQPYSPSPHAPPTATPPPDQQPPPQNRFEPSLHSNPAPPVAQPVRQSRPEGPAPSPQNRIPQSQTPTHHPQNYPTKNELMQHPPSKPPPESSQPVKTSPDPVIQMLATRAASNPELKALMRIVASSKANQAQLRTFQAHIDELNAILASRRQNESQNIPPHLKPDQQGRPFTPGPPQPPSSTPTSTPAAPTQSHPSHPFHPNGPNISSQSTHARASPSAHSTYPNQLPPQPIRSKAIQQPSPHNTYFHQHTPSQPPVAPPKPEPKAVVFEFLTTSPAGSSSGHASTGDRYLFPKNTILDYFPGGTTVIASFLVIKKIDPSAPQPDSLAGKTSGKAKSKKSKVTSATGTPTPIDTSNQNPTPAPNQGTPEPATNPPQSDKPTSATTGPETQPSTATTTETKPSPHKPKIKEYYQPVTMRIHANNPRTLEPLARVVNPPAEVRQYMNDIMDRMERADIEYLALRLPHEGFAQNGTGDEAGQTVGEQPSQPQQQQQARSARSKSKGGGEKGVDSGAENGVVVTQETGGGSGNRGVLLDDVGSVEDVQFEEELKEFYDVPSGIVPLRRRIF
ncbi:uncharacterized protein BDCG_03154 [Blastomyces dermatitidis ER-3]|uniref:SWR1-complex protein 3 domain-containing protein n=1 Tax=Ajellomyces dermatitidis (strain ER-3 / ATCC MYA-2586) TaxID=559297 RepID=A0ABP2EVN3_AJEDR|nr:uncharacterized protein BDCG_03154 [Blastomyces dermatitidis ER-3]EEQ88034.1 hypothetical protein BDCG_03154 [Blastomyces dermatitidis ER-3]